MSEHKKQSLLNGAMILSAAIIAVKIIGILFKLYVTLKIGFNGKGYFATAYNIYAPIYAIALAGLPTAVAKMVAAKIAEEKYKDVKKLFSVSNLIFALAGFFGTVIILLLTYPFTKSISSFDSIPATLAIAPSLFFCCVMSGYRGYYQGMRNMLPSAVSQIIEAAGKLIFGYILMNAAVASGMSFADKIPFLNTLVTDVKQSYAAAAAISGVTIGSIMGLLYLMLKSRFDKQLIPSELLEKSPAAESRKALAKQLIVISVPIALSALVFNITTLIDNWTVLNRLQFVLDRDFETVASMYPKIVSAMSFTKEKSELFKAYLYGAYDTTLEIKNIIPTFTITLGLSAIPVLSGAWAKNNIERVRKSIATVIRATMFIALPAGMGLAVLAKEILTLLYGNSPTNAPGIPYIAPILMAYGVSICFLALAQPITNMLQSIDRMDVPVKSMAIGAALKIAANFMLVSMPSVNIQGAVVGSILCNMVIVFYGLYVLKKATNIKYDIKSLLLKPLLCSLVSATGAYAVSRISGRLLGDFSLNPFLTGKNISTMLAIVAAVIIYAFSLLFSGALLKSDVIMLPKGEKIAKVLEKYGFLG